MEMLVAMTVSVYDEGCRLRLANSVARSAIVIINVMGSMADRTKPCFCRTVVRLPKWRGPGSPEYLQFGGLKGAQYSIAQKALAENVAREIPDRLRVDR